MGCGVLQPVTRVPEKQLRTKIPLGCGPERVGIEKTQNSERNLGESRCARAREPGTIARGLRGVCLRHIRLPRLAERADARGTQGPVTRLSPASGVAGCIRRRWGL